MLRRASEMAASLQRPSVIYPSRRHAAKVYAHLFKSLNSSLKPAIYVKGHDTACRDDTDREMPFHQEANFMYLTGAATVRGASALITLKSDFSGSSPQESDVCTTLFIPPVDPLEVMWSGLPPSPQAIHATLPGLSRVTYLDDLPALLATLGSTNPMLTLPAMAKTLPPGINASASPELLAAIHEARTTKTPEEVDLMRYANHVSSDAHVAIMKAIGGGRINSEGEAEAVYLFASRQAGIKWQAYESIFGYGDHASTLHYIANNAPFDLTKGAVLLVDAGGEADCYASDITRTIPVGNGGKFTKEARAIYEIVLEMQEQALSRIKAGADWEAIQLLMHRVAAEGLLKLGIFHSVSADELVEKGEVCPFFPHGIGHFLGIDTHDVGGLPSGRSKDPRIRYLRLRRPLRAGNVVTVEPGLYFNRYLLEPARSSPHVKQDVLERYLSVGGIRIEDNVVVTETGYDNLTIAPKSVAELEALCSGAA